MEPPVNRRLGFEAAPKLLLTHETDYYGSLEINLRQDFA